MLYSSLLISAFIAFCLCSGQSVKSSARLKGLLVVPGLGRADRLETVVHNIKMLKKNNDGVSWDCVIYIYAGREVESFWSQKNSLEYVSSECRLVEVPNQKVTQNLYMVQPALISQYYSNVFILLDDCKIMNAKNFNLTHILEIMHANKLTVASPMVRSIARSYRNVLSLFILIFLLRLLVQTRVEGRNSAILCRLLPNLTQKATSPTS